MHVRKERSHQCGLSNIDFRRLNDKTSLARFDNDMRDTNFGLMGRSKIPYSYQSCDFGNRQSLLVNSGFQIPEPPNPKLWNAELQYEATKKPFTLPSKVDNKRVTKLEDYTWNNKVFTGEDVGQRTWFQSKVSPDSKLQVGLDDIDKKRTGN